MTASLLVRTCQWLWRLLALYAASFTLAQRTDKVNDSDAKTRTDSKDARYGIVFGWHSHAALLVVTKEDDRWLTFLWAATLAQFVVLRGEQFICF